MRIRFYLRTPDPSPDELAKRRAEREKNPNYKHPKNKRKDLDPNKPAAIFAMIHYNANQLKFFLGETIIRKYWNASTQSARNSAGFPEYPEFNERLNQIKSLINKTFLEYKNKNNGEIPGTAEFSELLKMAFSGKSSKVTLLEYFQSFINRTINGERINPVSKKAIRLSGVRGYQTTLMHLKKFASIWKRRLDFETIDLEFYKDFNKYLSGSPNFLAINTIGSHTQRLKAVMSEATEQGHNSNMAFRSRYFIKQSEEVETIYLDEAELKELKDLDLSENPVFDAVRDMFLIACNTGLRHSDWPKLNPAEMKEGVIKIKQQKTDSVVDIPIRKAVLDIFEKHGGNLPSLISEQKTNAYLKEIAKKTASLKTQIETRSKKDGLESIVMRPKWEMVTTHTARRSFATNAYKSGLPTLHIMAITGHKTEKSFLKYIRISPNEHAKIVSKIWADMDKKSKLKVV